MRKISSMGRAPVSEHVERLTVIRKLTMTCWHLRNALFQLLWGYVEGCHLSVRHPASDHLLLDRIVPLKNGLHTQCSYLIHYVRRVHPCIQSNKIHEVTLYRALSVNLRFPGTPKDLITKFVDCPVRLPNLRRYLGSLQH